MALAFGLHCYERHDHCVHRGPYLRLSPATSPEKLSNFTHMALGFGLHCYERNDHCVHCGPYLRLSPATCPEKLAAVPHPVVPIATFFSKIVMGTSLYGEVDHQPAMVRGHCSWL